MTCSSGSEEEEIRRKIPSEIFAEEILPRLSSKDLQTLKCVCKDFLQLITTPYFVRLHLSRTRTRVILAFPPSIAEYYYQNATIQILPNPPQFSIVTRILGSADGLICLLGRTDSEGYSSVMAILNPSTGKTSAVRIWPPEIINHFCYRWFGKHKGEYFLVLGMWAHRSLLKFGVHRFIKNELKRVRLDRRDDLRFCFHPLEQRGTLAHGAVHWPAQNYGYGFVHHWNRYTILVYNIDDNIHSEIPPPAAHCDFRLGVHVDDLCATIVRDNVCELWVMKDQERWTKYANIDAAGSRVLSPLEVFPSGDMVFDADKSKLLNYNFNHSHPMPKPTLLLEYGCPSHEAAIMCDDSLVSPHIWED